QTCHAGPEHHASQKAADTPSCAGCHRDHRGRDASLVRVADAMCTACHDVKQGSYAEVHRFGPPPNHPEFQKIRDKASDPGRVKVNHKLHLTEGQVSEPGGKPCTLGRIADPAQRKRYADRQDAKADSAAVKLDCAACHQLDSGDLRVTK